MLPTVHLLCGKPGSGKTTFARRLEVDHRAVLLSADAWMLRLFDQHMPRPLFDARFRACTDLLFSLTARLTDLGVDVILDWGFWSRSARDEARARIAPSRAHATLYFFDVPDDVLLARLAERNRRQPADTYEIPAEMFATFAAKFEPPGDDEPCVRISSQYPPPMSSPTPAADWNGPSGDRWVREQSLLDSMLRPYGQAAMDALPLSPNAAILDVGCGCGDTSLTLADRVGPHGRVLGLDLSAPMLARARERARGRANVTFFEGDASTAPFERGAFDLLFSRFGVMFFADPVGAFAHLRTALRPAGAVAFACWRSPGENPWAAIPLAAAASVLGSPPPSPPDAPGPFAFADSERARAILSAAGFREPLARQLDGSNVFGRGGTLRDAVLEIARTGPVARLLVDRPDTQVAETLSAIERAIAPYAREPGGVSLPAAVWIVTARNGAD